MGVYRGLVDRSQNFLIDVGQISQVALEKWGVRQSRANFGLFTRFKN